MITQQEHLFDTKGLEMNKETPKQTKTIKHKIVSHGAKTFEPTLILYRNTLAFIVNIITIGGFKL
ncbi:hypothetical protein OK414_08590 [Priestia sp. JV24]|uniref:hypothetical protein n=1 Tax=Priestia TaxID=2800373 RepID=UPI0021D68A2A|nr:MULTISPECIES: hypothetical protein [Priestia]MCU7712375.1 hypothetical protein [Priestia megaterium]MCW1045110.1 hypothetical protein [Priestia sp. JV24]